MKKFLLAICIIASFGTGYAQDKASSFTDRNSDQPRDPRVDQMSFVPNEVLVKFKDEVPLNSAARLRSAGLSAVDKVLQANGIDSLVRLFPNTKSSLLRSAGVARIVKDPQGRDMKIPNLDKIFKITLPQLRSTSSVPVNIFQVIEDLKALPEVAYAEPNYIYSVDDLQPVGPVLTADDVKKMQSGLRSSQAAVLPNDPLYAQQWYIPAVKADLVWEQTTGDTTQVIGILDTGVDWNHPDLKNKIWTNPSEIPGNGRDDDGNGLIDDIRGWDYINNDNNPMDDNSHGTHVAGIAAAETNNGIGIAGVNWKAKIMPLKVFQSSGRGDAANIAKAIIYATNKGATVINMSFGSYARSMAMEDALANAYATTILVAAAGNDNTPIGPNKASKCGEGKLGAPFYPAALSYVLGVQSPESCFSNYDLDGPIYSEYLDLLNYEIKAPGTNCLSTIPNGNYRIYQGTSMAAPIISGLVGLYCNAKPTDSQEILFANLINTSSTFVDIQKAITVDPIPQISIVSHEIIDTLNGDEDKHADSGETIELKVTVRNTWGQSDSVFVGIKFREFEDTTTAYIEKGSALIGTIGTYASLNNLNDLLRIHIQPNVAHNRDIQFVLQTWKGSNREYLSEQFLTIRVEHGTELKGVLEDTLRLTSDKFWLVSNSFKIGYTGVLVIDPGTNLKIENNISNYGNIICIGKKDSLIVIEGPYTITGNDGRGNFKYVHFKDVNIPWSHNTNYMLMGNFTFDYCMFTDFYYHSSVIEVSGKISNCEFSNFNGVNDNGISSNDITYCNFYKMYPGFNGWRYNFLNVMGVISYNNFANSRKVMSFINGNTNIVNNNILGNFNFFSSGPGISLNLPANYWGTNDSLIIQEKIHDFWDESSLALVKYQPKLDKPTPKAHACVWKVVVNGKDAQDEFKYLDPLGVAKHKFEVYFNRPMDTLYAPSISMGVREPYNQLLINENGSWSADSLVYTAYKSLGLTVNNGLNRIKVIDGKDTDGFDLIPEIERFNVNIQTCTSASADFVATPGLGKVSLEWNNNNLQDGLGYNMYRMENINDSTLTSPLLINSSLINDTIFTDYSVTPNKKYFYYYKIVRTDLSETESSKVISSTPFTAVKGDANGDLSVNVLDITSIVAYLLNNNPQPFITEAADMNSDGNINVLDIVGVVNKVLYGGLRSTNVVDDQQVSLYLQNDTLFADATTAIGGVQFDISGITSINDIQVLNALQVFESGYSQRDSTTLRLLYYSMSGKSIAAGSRIPLLKLKKDCKLKDVIVSDKGGASIPVSLSDPTIGNRNDQGMTVAELGQNYPNPSKGQTTLPVQIFEKVDEAAISIYNMLGQQVKVIKLDNPSIGKYEIPWNSPENKGLFIYKLEIRSEGQQYVSPLKKMIVL